MKKRFLVQAVILLLCIAIGFVIGWLCKKPKIVEVVIKEPVIMEIEPKQEVVEEPEPTYKEMEVIATAYCPCVKCCGKNDGITATGVKAKANHTVAADPNVLPYGTEIVIGENTYIVEDCGGAVNGEKIDIFFNTHSEALSFGRQKLTILVKEN